MAPHKKILVTGSEGQLGGEFRKLAEELEDYQFFFTDVNDLDITHSGEVVAYFREHEPDFCINCAAYTAVDKAESEADLAYKINSEAVKHLTIACQLTGCKLIHFSSDYVYDSVTDRPILETDACTPKSVYGLSKRASEEVLEASNIDWICLRISWLYSTRGHNFVKTMTRLGIERDELTVVSDQIGAPTYAEDLAAAVMTIIEADTGYRQHYNFSNGGKTNWAEFAREIMKIQEIQCKISKTTTAAYGAAAPRPLWSILSHNKIYETFGIVISPWKASLRRCIEALEVA